MKLLAALFMLVLSMSSFATSSTKTFFYDGTQDSIQMLLRAEKTHTEYRYEDRQTICYRQDVFYRRYCQQTPSGTICNTVPEYRTVSYPCIQRVQISYQVKDYDVEATVDLDVAPITSSLRVGENFKVTLDGDMLYLSAEGSKNFFILAKKPVVSTQMTGSLKLINASYSAQLIEAAPIMKALSMTNISLKDNVLSFTMGPIAAQEMLTFHLNVKKAPLLGSDTVLFDRDLAPSDMDLKITEANSVAGVNIEKLGIQLASGRNLLTATASFKYADMLLNAGQFEKTEAGRTLIFKK
jgi:hypothetical protein